MVISKKGLSACLFAAAVIGMLFTGCSKKGSQEKAAEAEVTEAAEVEGAITKVGPESGAKMEMWTFVDIHAQFYATMLEKWNAENPDKQIQITFVNYPYADMHNKMTMAVQTGKGAPDLCDIEIGQFPNFMKGVVPFVPMNKYVSKYEKDIVKARLDIYGKDGNYYGIPTHVGATVMFYNDELLSQYGIDYKTIKTWDDYEKAGLKLKEASGGKVYMTSVDTGGTDWLWLSMAENGEDWTNVNGKANVELESVKKMIKMQKKWLDEGIAIISPAGHVDLEEGFANIGDGVIASFPKAMWYMSRFLNYMPEMAGKYAIAACPVYKVGQPRSVGIGGTGTVVSNQSKYPDLAAEFIAYAKLSYEGNVKIWEVLGFDTCNTTIWSDPKITGDKSNKYIAFFRTNPFDALNEIKNEIGKIGVTSMSPVINEQINLNVLVNCLESGADVDEELKAAQDEIDLEQ